MALADLLNRATPWQISESALISLLGAYYESGELSGNVTLDDTYPTMTGLDCGGSGRDVTLEDDQSAATRRTNQGKIRIIFNKSDGAEDLTVKDSGGSTVGTVSQNECAIFYCDVDAGWSLVFIITGSIS